MNVSWNQLLRCVSAGRKFLEREGAKLLPTSLQTPTPFLYQQQTRSLSSIRFRSLAPVDSWHRLTINRGPRASSFYLSPLPLLQRDAHYRSYLQQRSYTFSHDPTFTQDSNKQKRLLSLFILACCLGSGLVLLTAQKKIAYAQDNQLSTNDLRVLAKDLRVPNLDDLFTATRLEVEQACFEKLCALCRDQNWAELKKHKASAEQIRDLTGKTCFLKMVQESRLDLVMEMNKQGFNITDIDKEGNNALMIAVANASFSLVSYLINTFNFGINDTNFEGKTALHIALERGYTSIAQWLHGKGANLADWTPRKQNPYLQGPQHPLVLAVLSGNPKTVEFLMDTLKKPISFMGLSGTHQLLHLAILIDNDPSRRMLQYLLQECQQATKPLLSQQDDRHRTPLHLAAFCGNNQAIKILRTKTPIDQANFQMRTAVHWAVEGVQLDSIMLLESFGATLNLPDRAGITPMALAYDKKNQKKMQIYFYLEMKIAQATLGKLLPPVYKTNPPKNLVFQGGGARGIAYGGVVQALEEMGHLQAVERVAGNSSGAIAAGLVAVNCRGQKLKQALEKNFEEFFDPADQIAVALTKAKQGEFREIINEYWNNLKLLHPIESTQHFVNRLINTGGLYKGDKLHEWIEDQIAQGTKIKHCTFEELHQLVGESGGQYKDLYVFAMEIHQQTNAKLVKFSHEDDDLKRAVISDVIRASASIPGVFKQAEIRYKSTNGKLYKPVSPVLYVDPLLIYNFPIDAFDDNPEHWGRTTNRETLGFSLVDKSLRPDGVAIDGQAQLGFKDLAIIAYNALYNAEEIIRESQGIDEYRTLPIFIPPNVGNLTFALPQAVKDALVESAYQETKSFFQ